MLKIIVVFLILFDKEGCHLLDGGFNGIENLKAELSYSDNSSYILLNATLLRVIAQIDNNFQVQRNGKGNYEVTGGFTGNILLDLQYLFEFSVSITVSNKSMIRSPDGTPNGIAEYLIKNISDILVGEYYYLLYRARSMLPLHPITSSRSTVYFRQPNSIAGKHIFSGEFTYEVWKAIILMWSLLVIVTIGVSYLVEEDIDIYEIIFWLFSTIFHQSSYQPKTVTLRILFFFEICFAVLIMTFFSAGLVSKLSVQILPIKSLQDLIDYNFKTIIPEFYVLAYFSDFNNETGEGIKFGKNTIKPTKYFSSEDSIDKIVNGGFAYFTSDDTRIVSRKNTTPGSVCSVITSIEVTKSSLKTGFYVQKQSPLRPALNMGLLKIMETGLTDRYWTIHKVDTLGECPRAIKITSSREMQLTLNDVKYAYFIFQGGAFLSTIVLALEKLRKYSW